MDGIKFEFSVLKPEFPNAFVPEPQVLVVDLGSSERVVYVYCMANMACQILGGRVASAMGTLSLSYTCDYPNNVVAAGVNLRKLMYRFPESRGMARNVVFDGEWKHR